MTDTSLHRSLPNRLDNPLKSAVLSWESLLVLVALAIFIVNSFASPYFLNAWSLSDLTFNFTEKALIALAMALLIISGGDRPVGGGNHRAGLDHDGAGAAIWGGHASAGGGGRGSRHVDDHLNGAGKHVFGAQPVG